MTAHASPPPPIPALSVAPMMDRTDRHFRFFMRQITQHTLLYTEMVVTGAILFGDRHRFLRYHQQEHPVALQLGGDNPAALAQCARIAEDYGYDEVNLNVGCPSARVQDGNFGACLMAEPQRVADAVSAMQAKVRIPITVKHRIGINDHESYEFMREFVDVVRGAGCRRFTAHARIAVLGGLNPKENRTVPPLRYADVYRLKRELPQLSIEINGGITTLAQAQEHLRHVDAVMIGRAAYDDPYLFAAADREIFGDASREPPSRLEVLERLIPYAEEHLAEGGRLHTITRHLMGLYAGQPGARAWRRFLSERGRDPAAGAELLREAIQRLREERGAA